MKKLKLDQIKLKSFITNQEQQKLNGGFLAVLANTGNTCSGPDICGCMYTEGCA